MKIVNFNKKIILCILLIVLCFLNCCKKNKSTKKVFNITEINETSLSKNKIATNNDTTYATQLKQSYDINSLLNGDIKCITDYSNDYSIFDVDSVKFGKYDLDDDNMKDDLEWIVLTNNGKYAL